jgi:hypothetical protein
MSFSRIRKMRNFTNAANSFFIKLLGIVIILGGGLTGCGGGGSDGTAPSGPITSTYVNVKVYDPTPTTHPYYCGAKGDISAPNLTDPKPFLLSNDFLHPYYEDGSVNLKTNSDFSVFVENWQCACSSTSTSCGVTKPGQLVIGAITSPIYIDLTPSLRGATLKFHIDAYGKISRLN